MSKAISALHDGDQAAELAETEDDRTRIRGITIVAALLAPARDTGRPRARAMGRRRRSGRPISAEDIRERIRADAAAIA
jgi:hypothetical protein